MKTINHRNMLGDFLISASPPVLMNRTAPMFAIPSTKPEDDSTGYRLYDSDGSLLRSIPGAIDALDEHSLPLNIYLFSGDLVVICHTGSVRQDSPAILPLRRTNHPNPRRSLLTY